MAIGIGKNFSQSIQKNSSKKAERVAAPKALPAAQEAAPTSRANRTGPTNNSAAVERLNAPRTPVANSEQAGPSPRGTWANALSLFGNGSSSASDSREEEVDPEIENAQVMDRYFSVFDNAGGDDLDGVIGQDDIETLADGDYDRSDARERLLDQGVNRSDVDDVLDDIEDAAEYYQDNQRDLDNLDGADDGGDTDGRIGRGDLDAALEDARQDAHPARLSSEEIVSVLDENYSIFDNIGGGDGDGLIARQDLEGIAEGNYNRDAARRRLREQGVGEADLDGRLAELERVADQMLGRDEELYNELDTANDRDGDTDGDIRRGDLDRYLLDNRPDVTAESAPELTEQELADFQRSYTEWQQDPSALNEIEDLNEYSSGELLAIAQLQAEGNTSSQLQEVVQSSLDDADSLADLPQNAGFSALLAGNMNEETRERVSQLVGQDLGRRLDDYTTDRRGDSEADLAVDRLVSDIEQMAVSHPALGEALVSEAEALLTDRAGDLSDVRRADDSALSRANHAVTGTLNGAAGFVGDRLRDVGNLVGQTMTAPLRLAGEAIDFAVTNTGRLAGGVLDVAGADGVADRVRDTTQTVGDLANGVTDFVARQNMNFVNGFAEGAAGTVEGVTGLVTNPVGTVQGLVALAQDPSMIVESYGQIVEEHGFAGLAGNLAFEVVAGVATGGGSAAGAARLAGLSDNLANAGRIGGVAARGLDNLAGAVNHLGLPRVNLRDHLPGVASTVNRIPGLGNRLASGVARVENYVPNGFFNRNRDALPSLGAAAGRGASDAEGLVAMGREALGERAAGLSDEQLIREGALAGASRLDQLFGDQSALDNATISDAFEPITGRANVLQHLFDNWDNFEAARGLDQVTLARNILRDAGDGQVALVRLASGGPNPTLVHRAFDRDSVSAAHAAELGLDGAGQRRLLNESFGEGQTPFWASDRYGAYYGFADDYTSLDPLTGRRVMNETSGGLRRGQAAPLQNRTDVGELSRPDRDGLAVVSFTAPNQIGGRFGRGRMVQIRPVENFNWISQGRLDPLGDFSIPSSLLLAAAQRFAEQEAQPELDWLAI